MIFTEFRFVLFFAVAFGVHWALRSSRARKLWLLLCSYVFYGAWDWRFLSLILASSVIDFTVGLMLRSEERTTRRRLWLTVSLLGNLGLLGVFKYFDFFAENGAAFLGWLGIPADPVTLGVALPVGISFYTFQTLSYSIDVYRRNLEPTTDWLDLFLFVAFFPQLVAGPIVRAIDFLPQLKERRVFDRIDVRACLVLFLVGYVKKAVVSDGIAGYIDQYFAEPSLYDAASAWIATLLYTIQLYCDFSAYSDMAIATAGLLGYNLCVNFDFPYFATNITDFWRRWHISLSSWMADYLYIPLGGSRGSTLFVWRNITITWVLAGLWHGADWRYVIFGGMMAPALILHRHWVAGPGRRVMVPAVVGCAMTYVYICVAQIFFRSPDMDTALDVLAGFLLLDAQGELLLGDRLAWIWVGCAAVHWVFYRRWLAGWWRRLSPLAFTASYAATAALVLTMINPTAEPFIYFQF